MRSSHRRALLAAVAGGVTGFVTLFLREIGWVFGFSFTVLVAAFYLSERRPAYLGWYLFAGGMVPAAILGRTAVEVALGTISVGPETWIMLATSVLVASAGALVVYITEVSGMRTR